MKCQEVDRLLDREDREPLSRSLELAVDQHLESCRVCREAWAACRQLTVEHVPHAPAGLWLRIAAALPARSATQARWSRSLVVGGLLLAGAAAAAAVAWRMIERAPEVASAAVLPPVSAPAPALAAEPAPIAVAPAEAAAAASVGGVRGVAGPDGASSAAGAGDYALDPHSLVVVLRTDPAATPQAAADLAACHAAIVRELRAVNGLIVVAPELVAPFLATDLPEQEIARRLGAGSVLVVNGMNRCRAQQLDARTGAPRAGLMYGGPPDRPEPWNEFAGNLAGAVADATLKDAATLLAESRAAVLNPALDDRERADALFKFRRQLGQKSPALDADIVAAVLQLGASREPGVREGAWLFLRDSTDPAAVQPLLAALARDPVPEVRRTAALTLHAFVDDPLVRDALARAAAEDPDAAPRVPCCIPTVREAARRALLSEEELRASIVAAARDETLSPEARLRGLNSSVDGRGLGFPLDDETAQAVLDIGRLADDPFVRAQAWYTLSRASPSPEASRTLLDDLTRHSEDKVRAAAASGLRRYADDPAVRAALEQAAADAAPDVRSAARKALGR